MSGMENKQLMRGIFMELAEGNAMTLVDSLDEGVRWRISGESLWSRTFEGKRSVMTELIAPVRSRLADRLRIVGYRFIAENDLVVVEARGNNNLSKSGTAYNNSYCFVFRLAEGKIQDVTEYSDTELGMAVLGAPDF